MNWLPDGKRAAVCFTVDDVYPATSADPYEAGGDLGAGTLGRLQRLLERHEDLKATLFVTPDWRPVQLVRSRFLARLPLLANRLYHVDLHPRGRFRVDRSPDFVAFLNALPRTEIALHGLHHVSRGPRLAVEFQNQSCGECRRMLSDALAIFDSAGLDHVMGFAPPGWNLPETLSAALHDLGFTFVCSARDIRTRITPDARNHMSGLRQAPLLYPQLVGQGLVHIPTNFQATSGIDRAEQIVECNGLLSIKAHAFKHGGGYTLADGLDSDYCAYLDDVFSHLEQQYGDSLWWASTTELSQRWLEHEQSLRLAS